MQTLYTWDKCPHCGATEKVGDEVIEEQKAKKLLPADSRGAAIISPILLGSRSGLTVVTLMTAANAAPSAVPSTPANARSPTLRPLRSWHRLTPVAAAASTSSKAVRPMNKKKWACYWPDIMAIVGFWFIIAVIALAAVFGNGAP